MAPRLRNHKLKFLLQVFNLEGENSHLANDDIMATKSVLDYFMAQFAERRDRHVAALASCRERLKDFIAGYAEVYKHGRARLFAGAEPERVALVEELRFAYSVFLYSDWFGDEPKVA